MCQDTLLFVLGQKDPLNLHRFCFFYVDLVYVDGKLISFNTSLVGCLSFTLYINFVYLVGVTSLCYLKVFKVVLVTCLGSLCLFRHNSHLFDFYFVEIQAVKV